MCFVFYVASKVVLNSIMSYVVLYIVCAPILNVLSFYFVSSMFLLFLWNELCYPFWSLYCCYVCCFVFFFGCYCCVVLFLLSICYFGCICFFTFVLLLFLSVLIYVVLCIVCQFCVVFKHLAFTTLRNFRISCEQHFVATFNCCRCQSCSRLLMRAKLLEIGDRVLGEVEIDISKWHTA